METKNKGGWFGILGRTSQDLQSQVENAPAVDAPEPRRKRLRLGQRVGGPRRKAAPALFDNCTMVPVRAFETRCEVCGVRESYAIRPSPNGKGWVVVCDEISVGGVEYTLAERRAAHTDQCTRQSVHGLDFRTIARFAGETYLVVRAQATVAPVRTGDESEPLLPMFCNPDSGWHLPSCDGARCLS